MFIRSFESFKSIELENKYLDFLDLLKKYNVPIEKYGTEKFKTIGHLYNEIKEGETILKVENGELVRHVSFVGARVIFKTESGWLHLYEEKQVFKDGRVRRREHMPYSAAEKFKTGEDPKKVIIRGVKEELGIVLGPNQFTFYNEVRVEENNDYPGIKSFHKGHEFLIVLKENQYEPEGYIERQVDKDVYFKWKEKQFV